MTSIVLFSMTIFCVTIQLWLVMAAVLTFVPAANALKAVVVPEWQWEVFSKWDSLLFHAFVAMALAAQAIGIWSQRQKILQPGFKKGILPFLATEIVWTALMLNACFKILVYHQRPWLAQDAFLALSLGALISKVFWPELNLSSQKILFKMMSSVKSLKAEIIACAALFLLLYVPDVQAVLARMFMGDQFHHFDSFLAPAWGFYKGGILNVDIMTEYGIGIPVIMAGFAKLTGGFSYAHMFDFWLYATILYFVLCFIFLRRWLGSFGLSLAGVLLAIKFQMFHSGVTPFVFTLPSACVVRYFWDIVFFLCLLAHLRTLQKRFLIMAALCCGIQIFCMTTCGYCLTLGLITYLAAFMLAGHLRVLIIKRKADYAWVLAVLALVPLTLLVLLEFTQGSSLWTKGFWQNMQEFDNYFLSGFGLMPMYETLQNKETLAGIMGFFIPVFYLGTLLVTGAYVYWQKAPREYLIATCLSLYGLGLYHYYIGRSAPTSYYVVCIPYVLLLAFWAQQWLSTASIKLRQGAILALFLVVIYALLTNHTYLAYPNMLNPSRNPIVDPLVVSPLPDGRSYFNQNVSKVTDQDRVKVNDLGQIDEGLKYEKDFKTDAHLSQYYHAQSNFSTDATLIDSLTNPQEPVALLSSFEMSMLMQADRRQFFYYSPILIARPLGMRNFPNSTMYTTGHMQRTLKELVEQKPRYVFMEKIFLEAPGFKHFQDAFLGAVLNFVFSNYVPYEQGQYLVAMKLKGP